LSILEDRTLEFSEEVTGYGLTPPEGSILGGWFAVAAGSEARPDGLLCRFEGYPVLLLNSPCLLAGQKVILNRKLRSNIFIVVTVSKKGQRDEYQKAAEDDQKPEISFHGSSPVFFISCYLFYHYFDYIGNIRIPIDVDSSHWREIIPETRLRRKAHPGPVSTRDGGVTHGGYNFVDFYF